MKYFGELLTKHRNLFLIGLLATTLACSAYAQRHQQASATVNIPVMAVSAQPLNALESFRQQRDQSALTDIAVLEKLIAQPTLDDTTRKDAAAQLQAIVDERQAQTAIEGALSSSSLSPCVAVVQGDNLTIVTEKADITKKDSALVLTLAAAHAGIAPENVRILPTE